MLTHNITLGLPGEQLDSFIDRFSADAAKDPFSTWLILPTERLVRDVTHILVKKEIPFVESRICTLNNGQKSFCRIIFEENRTTESFLSKDRSKLLLTQVLDDLKKDPTKDVSLFITRDYPSSGTIDDIMTFMKVILTRKVLFPECLMDLESKKSDQLDTIIAEYLNRLKDPDLGLNLEDSNTILQWTINYLNLSRSSPLGAIFIYGFHDLLPLEQDLFDTMREHAGKTYFFISDGIDPNIFRSRTVAGTPPAFDLSSARAKITGLFSETGTLTTGEFFRVKTFPTRYIEVYSIAAEISRLNAAGTPPSDIVVVYPALRDNLGLIEEVFSDFDIHWNTAVGARLSRAPVIQFLTGITDLAANGYTRENIVRLIGSPFFHKGLVPGGRTDLDAGEVDLVSRWAKIEGSHPNWTKQLDWLHQEMQESEKAKNFQGISVHSVERVQEGIAILLNNLNDLSKKKPLKDHIERFKEFLNLWNIPYLVGAPDELLHEQELRINKKFLSSLDALARIAWIPADEPIDAQEFARLISSLGEEGDESGLQDSTGVAVLGPHECQHLTFPTVFIGGLVEGTFPRLTTSLPFTNSLENTRMGTRSLAEILREEQYYFIAALLSAQKTVYLSAPLADGEKPLLTSAFFERVRMRTGEKPWPDAGGMIPASRRTAAVYAGTEIRDEKICAALGVIPDSLAISDLVERINMERFYRRGTCDSPYDGILSNESIRAVLAERYGPAHVYSPTSLETYACCPFEYFLNRVINLKELPEVEPNLSASDRGTAIHDILSTFYRQWRSAGKARVNSASLIDATEMILRIAAEELDTYSFQSPLWDATRILMLGDRHTGPGYFERFLVHETEESDSPLVPSLFEYSFGMGTTESDDPLSSPSPVELASPDGERKVFIRGRIDRIDCTPDGNFLIYDYKSCSQHPKTKDIEEGTALQLPLYLLAFEKITGNHGIGGGYYMIRREVDRSIVFAEAAARELMMSRPKVSADFAGMIRHSRDCAFAYIDGIRNGSFPLPREEKCPNPYCDFKRICRFDPYRVFDVQEET
ncbi:MAG: PD-(D/E)XK nuclease family protein [Methanomicrobiales archaeon]